MDKPYDLSKKYTTTVTRDEANFDRACDAARRMVVALLGVDEDGCITNVNGSERSDLIVVEFTGYTLSIGMSGSEHYYQFSFSVIRVDE